MSLKRVVITGTGAVSPFGVGTGRMLENLFAGKSAVVNLKSEWESKVGDLLCWVAAPLKETLNEKAIERKFRKTMGRVAYMSHFAVQEALRQAGLADSDLKTGRIGVAFGSSTGSAFSTELFMDEYRNHRMSQLPSGIFFQIMSHTCAANIAQAFNLNGRVISTNCACSSAAQAIGLGYEMIRHGQQDAMVCGGADELHITTVASFDLVQAASCGFNDRPEKTPRPFDRLRDGTVCGEGAGSLILETEERARQRGARILGEIAGFATFTSGVHMSNPDLDSIAYCMEQALASADLKPSDIDYINAHATGTQIGDMSEAQAIRKVFGEESVPASSLKGHMAHTLGASGALETIASLEMMERGILLPNLNLDALGEECKGIAAIQSAVKKPVNTFIKNSFAFGGINSVLIIRRYE
jgi:3-oxoacyl-[acyl-carrier-protein] synthase II